MNIQLAPSILAANFAALGQEIDAAARGGADLIHVDVMDGHFVPNITIGPPVVKSIRKVTTLPLDVHLMIMDPDRYVDAFVDAGANLVSVHVEVLPHLHRTIAHIKKLGARAGVVINPATPVSSLHDIAADVDFVLVMSVNPGFGGQIFIPHSLNKIRAVRELLDRSGNPNAAIEVDGGVDLTTVASVVQAGAEMLVAGNAIFGHPHHDAEAATRELRAAAVAAAEGASR
jgi:ribulose-phosphate 3-epimerase